ncbi:SDR family oxidoreductase [Pelagibacteraceae bacterium]|nr:SDR family oxidoreductase [Pelagibacteraceae bacterium]
MKIFITGGGGYCGSRLVPYLLNKNFKVTVFDTFYFTDKFLNNHPNLTKIKGDIRDTNKLEESLKNHDIFVHLACISNDSSFELNSELSKSINYDCFEPMVLAAKRNKIKKFIYASSSSVYGVSDKKNVTEEHPLVPLTLYNKFKGLCEPILLEHTDDSFSGVVFRPATVCGYAPRLRLDLSVNILTNHAINNKKIIVFGGNQLRPNLHIQDYCEFIEVLINAKNSLINQQIFNVGYQNLSILEIANLVKKIIEKKFNLKSKIEIEIEKSSDNRSYHINSDKVYKILNFKPKYSIENAIDELYQNFNNGNIVNSFDDNIYFNVKRMKDLNII